MYDNVRFNEKQAYIVQKNGVRKRVYTREENKRIRNLPDMISPYESVFKVGKGLGDTRKSMKLRSGAIRSKKAKSIIHQRIG